MIFEALATYIEANMGTFKQGKNLFINQAPEQPVAPMMLLRDHSGGLKIDGEIPSERAGRFQLIVRGKKHSEIMPHGREVSKLLTDQGLELDNVIIKMIRPMHEPLAYQRSEGGLFEISVNFAVVYGIVEE
jgi:hypothetical protein